MDGIVHNTYRSVCEALNLLENDNNWDKSVEDSSATSNPFQIRTLFAIMNIYNIIYSYIYIV